MMNKFVLYDYFSSHCNEINNILTCGSCMILATKNEISCTAIFLLPALPFVL